MSEHARDRYIAELDDLLPFPPERRAEILEEIATHLDDAVADREERGIPSDRAETDAQARLGAPRDLARDLARPEQTARRLLAAAGSGVGVGIGQWVYGYLVGTLVIMIVSLSVAAAVQLTSWLLIPDWRWPIGYDAPWNSVLTAGAIGLGLFFAGRAVPETVSNTSRRLYRDVRAWVAVIGTSIAFALLVFVIEMAQNLASVTALSLVPFTFALGVYRPELMPRVSRAVILGLLLLISVSLLISVAISITVTDRTGGDPPPAFDRNMSTVGPWWGDPDARSPFESTGWSMSDGTVRTEYGLADNGALAGLRDLRVEAWHAESEAPWSIDPLKTEPFAVAPAERIGQTIVGEVVTDRTPGVNEWQLVLTGVGPDGERYVLEASGGGSSSYTGTAWDWMVAVTD